MSVLIGLPSVLFAIISREWLILDDLASLDTACCNSTLRFQLLAELRQLPPVENAHNKKYLTPSTMYQWFYLRDINLKYIKLSDKNFTGKQLQFNLKYADVTILDCSSCYVSDFSSIANSCTNLKDLTIHISHVSRINDSILANLHMIVVEGDSSAEIGKQAMKRIIDNCKNLDYFGHNECECPLLAKQIKLLFKRNPKLRLYHGQGRQDLLHHLFDSYPNIEEVSFTTPQSLDLSLLCKILKRESELFWMISGDNQDDFSTEGDFFFYTIRDKIRSVDINFDISEANLMLLMQSCKRINKLEMGKKVRCRIVPAVNQFKHCITSLSFCYSGHDSYEDFANCFTACKQLTTLKIQNVNKGIVNLFESEFPQITSLHLKVEPDDKMCLSTVIKILQKCPNLKKLHIDKVKDLNVSFSELDQVLQSHKCLKDVEILYEIHQFKKYSYNGHKIEDTIHAATQNHFFF